jgi:hypothetical protein
MSGESWISAAGVHGIMEASLFVADYDAWPGSSGRTSRISVKVVEGRGAERFRGK